LMEELEVGTEDRAVVAPAHEAAEKAEKTGKGNKGIFCGAAVELADERIITGMNSPLMHAASAVVLNAIKTLADIPDHLHLLAPNLIDSVGSLKRDVFNAKSVSLDLEEALIALSISAAANPAAGLAMDALTALRGCEMHMTHIPSPGDETGLRRLGVNLTTDPVFSSKNLFQT